MKADPQEKIEILSVDLLEKHRARVDALKQLAYSLGIGLGWHYLLDLSWILDQLEGIPGKRILDAGAGEGLLQWFLAEQGADVVSVDRESRAELSLHYRARYQIRGMSSQDLAPGRRVLARNISQAQDLRRKLVSLSRGVGGILAVALSKKSPGKVLIYNQDLQELALLPDESLDAVVAVSALEHNSPEWLECVVEELMRVLKPGCPLLATLCASGDKDWFHGPSKGWCYTEQSLRRIFHLSPDVPSNYTCYDKYFLALRDCSELRDNLASFYFHSGDNGMPWGKWDPHYLPVGVCKIK